MKLLHRLFFNKKQNQPMKELTFGQQLMGVSFNPSGDPVVTEIKQMYADIADKLNDLRSASSSGEQKRQLSVAITEAQGAKMWAIQGLTWKDPVFDFEGNVLMRSEIKPVLVDFYSETCAPCKVILPQLLKLSAEKNVELEKIHSMNNQELAREHGVRGVPHVMLYYKGKKVAEWRGYGESTIEDIAKAIDEIKR